MLAGLVDSAQLPERSTRTRASPDGAEPWLVRVSQPLTALGTEGHGGSSGKSHRADPRRQQERG